MLTPPPPCGWKVRAEQAVSALQAASQSARERVEMRLMTAAATNLQDLAISLSHRLAGLTAPSFPGKPSLSVCLLASSTSRAARGL